MDLLKVSIRNCDLCDARYDVRGPGHVRCVNCDVALGVIEQWFTILSYRWKAHMPISRLERQGETSHE